MTKNYLIELRDKIASSVLAVLLLKVEHLDFEQMADLSYEIADIMLISRNKQLSIFNNIKENKNE